ncbi:MAG: hypothetical protein RI538_02370 [Salibaculum sp.]|jgi:hypothetical protein|uniref:hypothetical protein n=1 Tax=Salibaculum sp. TaxID=2855480 RepID=UPI0028701267|nr:hypothetical protein [Salibaculum sp.]MDR9427645.1 hypothetical protein [Salibaculum sp.]MDR9481613.1 hypothetical protein [Salibaculum sp.]
MSAKRDAVAASGAINERLLKAEINKRCSTEAAQNEISSTGWPDVLDYTQGVVRSCFNKAFK